MTLAINNSNLHRTPSGASFSQRAFAPLALIQSAQKTANAYLVRDPEGTIEGVGKISAALDLLISGTSAFFHGVFYITMWLNRNHVAALPIFFTVILLPYAILGLALSFLQIAYEGFNLVKGVGLRWSLKFSDNEIDLLHNQEKIKKEFFELTQEEERRINTFLEKHHPGEINAPIRNTLREASKANILENKLQNLGRRISLPAAKEIKKIIHSNAFIDRRILSTILDEQTSKMLKVRATMLISLLLSAVCYALVLVTSPHIMYVSLALAVTSILFYLLYFILEKGFLEVPGNSFSFRACIPERIRKLINGDTAVPAKSDPWSLRVIQLRNIYTHQFPDCHHIPASSDL